MRKLLIIVVSFVFAAKVSFAQKTFSECYDTLYYHLTKEKDFNAIRDMNDWENCINGKDATGKVRAAWIGGATDKTAETAVYLKAKPIMDELLKGE